jgi:adenine phosphoribosyltransferase
MRDYLRLINRRTPAGRCDVTPVFAEPAAFAALVADLALPFRDPLPDLVVGIDALGFVLGAALSMTLQRGLVPLRKAGKLPVAADSASFEDYSAQRKALELAHGAIPAGARVLIADEWIETGAQAAAAIDLIEGQGGVVIGVCAVHIDDTAGTRALKARYRCHSVSPGI